MKITAIDHVQLAMPVGEEARAKEFYEGILGLKQFAKPAELAVRGGAWFENDSVKVHLGVETDFRPARKAHPAFVVEDLPGLIALLKDRGYLITPAEMLDGIERIHVADPFGNRIELMNETQVSDQVRDAINYLVPTALETPRLTLRMLLEEDWRALHEHYSDPVCTQYTQGRVLTEGESWRTMAGLAGHWLLRRYGPYAVVEKQSGAVVGMVGLLFPADWPEPEIMWMLVRKYWGNGYASEAARAVRQMAHEHLPGLSLISMIDARNSASIRVATSVGATFERETPFRGGMWHVYRHPQ